MKVALAYLSVVIIWSTTPLAIKWSNDSFSYIAAVTLRMAIACALILLVLKVLRRPLFAHQGVWKTYVVASLGLFPSMPLVYWAAQYISSGMIALIFSMTPIATGIVTIFILRENPFSPLKVLALFMAIAGLVVVFGDQVQLHENTGWAVAAVFCACSLMGGSSVILKGMNVQVSSMQQTTGALLFSLPALLCVWWLQGGLWPDTAMMSSKSLVSIVYLAVFGSLLGFTLYFFLLSKMSPTSLSLVTLITPVSALYIGYWVNSEVLSAKTIWGAGFIVLALALYQGVTPRKLIRLMEWRSSD